MSPEGLIITFHHCHIDDTVIDPRKSCGQMQRFLASFVSHSTIVLIIYLSGVELDENSQKIVLKKTCEVDMTDHRKL